MQIRRSELNGLARTNGYKNGRLYLVLFGAGDGAYGRLRRGCRIGYELVRELYNALGEETVAKIINFEKETLHGFKSKYKYINGKLY